MARRIGLVLVLMFSILLQSCGESDYYEGSKWECSVENFHDEYGDAINNAIVELTNKYSITCTHEVDVSKQGHILHYIYNDVFTYYLFFGTNNGDWGIYEASLYYFGDDKQLKDYSYQKDLVYLFNELTCSFAYRVETDKNMFEEQYIFCIDEQIGGTRTVLHFDEYIGYVEYGVVLDVDNKGYYYQMMKNEDIQVNANYYYFRGLLRSDIV